MVPVNREQAFVMLALHTLHSPCEESQLETLYGHGRGALSAALETLRQRGSVRCHVGAETLWENSVLLNADIEPLAALVRVPLDGRDISHLLGYTHPTSSLDDSESALWHMTEIIRYGWSTGMNLYVELVINLLIAWAERHGAEAGPDSWRFVNLVLAVQCFSVYSQHNLCRAQELGEMAQTMASVGNERIKPFLDALRLFLTSLSRYPEQDEVQVLAEQVEEAERLNEPALGELMPWLRGMLHFLRGEYREVIAFHHRIREQPHWWYKRLFSILALNSLYSANYLGLYHLAAGISESARQTAALSGESIVSLSYRLQQCFLQLRIRDMKLVREGLEYVTASPIYAKSYVLKSLSARLQALYHYMEDDVHAANTFLAGEVRQAMAQGLDVTPFHDPIILDMLYVFEKEGYPPIPMYTLDTVIDNLQQAANIHLRGAALRIKALRERDRGAAPERVAQLLRESLQLLVIAGDSREMALSAHELANALEHAGQQDEALRIRQDLSKAVKQPLNAATDYRQASIACLSALAGFVPLAVRGRAEVPHAGFPHSGMDIIVRCHTAFHEFPVHENVADMYVALVKIAQIELGAEQAALFTLDGNGRPCCMGAVNMSVTELESERMQPCLRWLQQMLRDPDSFSCVHEEFGLCLVLDAGGTSPWVLSVQNRLTEGLAKCFNSEALQELSRLFAAELRSCLRMDKVRDAVITTQYVKLKSIVSMREEGAMPPLLGDGMRTLMRKALQVSATDAPILLWGETGVGKEVMARQIHNLSECPGPFIAIHPASMPETLFESECFGYERGAFTGANKQKIGLFELADQGTLFIDEIGEISPSIQTKLLRVLQEKRFMRVGGTHEIASRFRLVAATNRDLWKEVLEGRFRQDLLYRISVVPLKIPTLRERRQDILPMATAFINHFSRHYGKTVLPLRPEQQERLCAYSWPGNIRELRNVIERAVILNEPGEQLYLELANSQSGIPPQVSPPTLSEMVSANPQVRNEARQLFLTLPSLHELEEQYLRYVMGITNGRVLGTSGAAALLRMKVTTLYARLRKYGIRSSGRE